MNSIHSPALSSIWPAVKLRRNELSSASMSITARAVPFPIIVLATTAPSAGKLSVLLKTGGLCLVAYWVANFVVPGIVLKDLQSKDTEEKGEDEP